MEKLGLGISGIQTGTPGAVFFLGGFAALAGGGIWGGIGLKGSDTAAPLLAVAGGVSMVLGIILFFASIT